MNRRMFVDSARKKMEVLIEGTLSVRKDFRPPHAFSTSRSGPDAGHRSLVLEFEGHRLKVPVVRGGESTFALEEKGNSHIVLKNATPFIGEVSIIPCDFHAPAQAFINLEGGCRFDCAFCSLGGKKGTASLEPEKASEMILNAWSKGEIESAAITSGVMSSSSETAEKMAEVVKRVRKDASLPLGVEPYLEDIAQVQELHSAGADEMKINIHSWNREIFRKICPGWDFDRTLEMVEEACAVFGKGNVSSNILFGLGESDQDIVGGIEHLASLGCAAVLRKTRVTEDNRRRLLGAVGQIQSVSPERWLALAMRQKEIFERYGMDPGTQKTMCHPCGCCDIVPFKDI